MNADEARNPDRVKAAIGVAGLHALFGYALITGLAVEIPAKVSDNLKLFDIRPAPPPAPIEKTIADRASKNKPEGANIKAKPAASVAPPPVMAAPTPGVGSDPSAGASDVRGPGTGSGGQGAGTGSGDEGSGTGGTGQDRKSTRLNSSHIQKSRMPSSA